MRNAYKLKNNFETTLAKVIMLQTSRITEHHSTIHRRNFISQIRPVGKRRVCKKFIVISIDSIVNAKDKAGMPRSSEAGSQDV